MDDFICVKGECLQSHHQSSNMSFQGFHVNSDLGTCPSHLFHLRQVRIDVVAGVQGVPVLHVLVYLLFQEICDLAVVGEDGLMRSWQVFHQGREAVI